MYMFYYFIRIAREILGRRNLQRIIIIGLLFLVLAFCFGKLGAFAYDGLDGDDTYTDPNNSIFQVYDGYLNDLAVRLLSSSSDDCEDLINRLLYTKSYSFVCFYGFHERDYSNDFQHMRVVLFPSTTQFATTSAYNQWVNMDCEFVYNNTTSVIIYDFTDTTCVKRVTSGTFYIPYMLINRYNTNLINAISNMTNNDTQQVINALNSQTAKIEQGNAIAQQTQDFVTDDTITSSEMSVDTSSASFTDNTGIDNFFTSFLQTVENTLSDYNEGDVSTITIPLPYNNSLTLYSNIISKYIVGTAIAPLITVFWTFTFGGYIISYIYRMIKWLSTGQIFNEGGVSDFIWYLDTNNEIIKGYMM